MRGTDDTSGSLFSYLDLEDRIPARHPLRKIRQVVNDALVSLDGDLRRFWPPLHLPDKIAPSKPGIKHLMEQMQDNLMFRWFFGLGIDDFVSVPTVFTKNRDRLLTTEMSRKFVAAIFAHSEVKPLLCGEHCSVDGTLIKDWASTSF